MAIHRDLADDPELRLRIGIHQGDVTFEGNRVSGDGVNMAARIRPLAEPGGICVSDDVQHSLRGRADLEFASIGERELKNVGRPVAVFAVGRPGTVSSVRAPARMGHFYGTNVFLAESSSTAGGLDSLLEPKSTIKEAHEKAARCFGTDHTYFVTNGTSTANKIVVQALCKPGDVGQ